MPVTLRQGQPEIRASAPASFYTDIPAVWRANVLTIGTLVLMVAGLGIGNLAIKQLSGNLGLLVNLAVGTGPALLWLFFLYQTSSQTEENISPLALTIFVLGGLIAIAVTRPVLNDVINLNAWLARTIASRRFTSNILIAGFWHCFVLYAMVRYTVWQSPVFSRRTDGVLYAEAGAWGYAAALNLLFILDNGGVTLLNGNIRLLSQLPPFVVSGLIIGYFLGKNRFEEMPFYFLVIGQIVAAVFNGLLIYAANQLNNTAVGLEQDGYGPWGGLIAGMIALIAVMSAIYGIIGRENSLTQARLERGS